jgi:hypothetical protein
MQDPTLETTQIVLGGKTYTMCFDLEALAEAETELIRAGIPDVNLLHSLNLGSCNLQGMRALFAASLRKFQPELKMKDALALVTTRDLFAVGEAVADAWQKAVGLEKGDAPKEDAAEVPLAASPEPSAG